MAGNSDVKSKAPKKGANLLCRIKNPKPENVCAFVKRLPKHIMPEDKFRSIMGKEWFANEHQAPEQWGLYYIDGKNYYPRFNRNISLQEADAYLSGWLKRFIVINPYTTFKRANDNGLVLSIVNELENNPSIKDLKTIMTSIIGANEPFIINDILVNAINTYSEVLKVEIVNKENELFTVSLLPNYKKIIKNKYVMTKKEYFDLFDGIVTDFDPNLPLQQITYGAPGTGKSYETNELTKGQAVIRTTFHPDSDYSTFVGAYKPTMGKGKVYGAQGPLQKDNEDIEEDRITYTFVKQSFLKAYLLAWKKYAEAEEAAKPQFLIIEEINRGNCAQIFGDLFQLLDRADNKFSSYPIEADTDLQHEIERAFMEDKVYKLDKDIDAEGVIEDYTSNYSSTLSGDIQHGRVLLLPSNLYIWATMNTSDQSLFPIDSAFKRRWEWKYMKIKNEGKEWKLDVRLKDANGEKKLVDWWDFISKINEIIASMTSSADKQLGYFFCKADKKTPEKASESNSENDLISIDTFVSKVLFYLWNDVFKDYGFEDASLFQYTKTEDGKETKKDLTFPDFYKEDSNDVNPVMVNDFVQKVMSWKKKEDNN